jgi:hypothetical protein
MPTDETTRELIEQANIINARAEASLQRIKALRAELEEQWGIRRRPDLRLVKDEKDE